MIFYKLDYVIETEQARQRDAARCAAYARPRGASESSTSALRTKVSDTLKRLAKEYLTHQGWKAHEGVFEPVPLAAAASAGARVQSVRRRVDPVRELKRLAGVKLSAREAAIVWSRLLEHKWYMGERMGRDVGLRVAAADYFENIEPPRLRVKARTAWEPLPRLPMMLPFGERG